VGRIKIMARMPIVKIKTKGSVMTFYEKGMKKGRKKSNQKYKDLPATEKIRLKAERRHLKMVQMLYSILLRKAPFPYWFITLIREQHQCLQH
jgi:hypothetical protein